MSHSKKSGISNLELVLCLCADWWLNCAIEVERNFGRPLQNPQQMLCCTKQYFEVRHIRNTPSHGRFRPTSVVGWVGQDSISVMYEPATNSWVAGFIVEMEQRQDFYIIALFPFHDRPWPIIIQKREENRHAESSHMDMLALEIFPYRFRNDKCTLWSRPGGNGVENCFVGDRTFRKGLFD